MANPDVIRLWIDELESGKYTQGQGFLAQKNNTDGADYCCLGILCEAAVREAVIVPAEYVNELFPDDDQAPKVVAQYGTQTGSLPHPVSEWAGVMDFDPEVTINVPADEIGEDEPSTIRLTLAELNDEWGYSFTDIANVLRANFLEDDSAA